MDRVVAALLRADRPRRARIAGLGCERVVRPLAVRVPDRMHGRQVNDVEAELRELWEHVCHPAESAPRAREELVPRAEAREHAVDVDLERRRGDDTLAVAGLGGEAFVDGD